MKLPWQKDYAAGADVITREDLLAILNPGIPALQLADLPKPTYTLLDRDLGHRFYDDNVTVHNELTYGGNLKTKDESYPNCEDFAVAAFGELLTAWLKHGGQHALAVGLLTLTPKWFPTGLHEEHVCIWKGGVREVYEPQTGGFNAWNDEVLGIAAGARMG